MGDPTHAPRGASDPMGAQGTGTGRGWWLAGIALVSAWFLYLYFYGPKAPLNSPQLEGTGLSRPAEYAWMLHDLDGTPVEFSRFRGKTVFLNIWATWCPPCVAELPAIANLARAPGLDQVAFVCVAIDQDPETVRRFLRGKDLPMTVLHAEDRPDVFTTRGIPATFIISPDGRIAASTLGSAEWDDPSVVEFLGRLRREAERMPVPVPAAAAR